MIGNSSFGQWTKRAAGGVKAAPEPIVNGPVRASRNDLLGVGQTGMAARYQGPAHECVH